MTATNPRTRTSCRRASAAWLVVLLALAGCKSTKDSDATAKNRDPLVYGSTHIPPQNVPVPDRNGIGAKGTKSDPLLDRPVGKSNDKTGVGYSDDPDRFKGTFIPGVGSTPAALAGKGRDKDGDELKIDTPDNRVPLRQVGGVEPAASVPAGDATEPLYTELAKYGSKPENRTLVRDDSGTYIFRASVPISAEGAKREYQGAGKTANDAVKQVLDQVVSDRK